ncbi:MAG: methyltransferase domain-containing protein [Proteobacteria bacterium]|nr:methyltransferase domain-containing protein [Pseudomonadota bacterium]
MQKNKEKTNTIRLQNLSYAHKQSATLMAAIDLELFTHVSQGASRLPELAEAMGVSSLNTERLVVACTALELLEKSEGRYRNAADVERFLVKGRPTYIGPWMLFSRSDFEQWKDLTAHLKSEAPPKTLGLYETLTDDMARQYHEATYSVGLGAGILFARDVDLRERSMILDLGGGSGAYCIAALQRYPHLKAVVFDFEPVCKMTREFVAQWKLSDSISAQAGDFTRDPLPPGADVMIMASNLPQYDGESLVEILKKAHQALLPGGEYHIVGETLDDQKCGPLGPALWGIHEALFGSRGRSHSEREVTSYLEKAGFIDIEVHPFIPGSLSRITGRKNS